MKKLVLVAVAAVGLAAAGAANAQADLAQKSGCMNCHDVSTKKVGPSFKDIAAKFKGKADAEKTLTAQLKEGKGHPAVKVSDSDLSGLIKWVLAQ